MASTVRHRCEVQHNWKISWSAFLLHLNVFPCFKIFRGVLFLVTALLVVEMLNVATW